MLPISALLVNAKVADYDHALLRDDIPVLQAELADSDMYDTECDLLYEVARSPKNIVGRAFDKATLDQIVRAKNVIRRVASRPEHRAFLLVGLLSILESFGAARKSGGWLKLVDQGDARRDPAGLVDALHRRLVQMLAEIGARPARHNGEWTVVVGDARDAHPDIGPVDAVITSPPYLNRHDYTRVLSLELLVGFATSDDELKEWRYNLISSHPEVKGRPDPEGYERPADVIRIVSALIEKQKDVRVARMVDGYFRDMFAVLSSLWRIVRPGGHVAFVLGKSVSAACLYWWTRS